MPFRFGQFSLRALFSKTVTGSFLILVFAIFIFNFSMNMHSSSGLPYWDDWQYFFGTSQGLHVPLTLKSLLAKEADYVTPAMRVFGHLVWLGVGADFLVLRLIGWVLFGLMLVLYARFLLRFSPSQGWAGMVALLCLVSTAGVEYFHYQHMAMSQPLFFLVFLSYLWLAATGRTVASLVLLVLAGSFSIFGSAYALGAIGYAAALAIAAYPRHGFAAFKDPRVWAGVPVGLAVAAGIGYLTFSGSYVNHTGQGLVGPWTVDFWIFLLSAFAAALGFPADMATRHFLPLGLFGFLLYAWPLWRMLRQPPADERARGEFALGALLAGSILVIMMTGAGRAHLCGTDLGGLKGCGATPRYVFPLVVALPTAVLAMLRTIPGRLFLRPLAALAILVVIAAGYGLDRNGRPSVARWDFAPLNRMMAERDGLARSCLADYLVQALPAQAGAAAGAAPVGEDWSRPLICPSMWTASDLAPYLRRAYETDAPFLRPIVAGLDEQRRAAPLRALLASGILSEDGRALRVDLPVVAGDVVGYADRADALKDGTAVVTGWAADVKGREPAAYVVAVIDGRVAAVGPTGAERPDVAASLGDPRFTKSGFVLPMTGAAAALDKPLRVFAVSRASTVSELTVSQPKRAEAAPVSAPAPVPAPAPTPALSPAPVPAGGSRILPATEVVGYADGRPFSRYRLDARDQGVVLRHGGGPAESDALGARDAWVFRDGDTYHLHYDAAGPSGWLAALATSGDGIHFEPKGPVLALGAAGEGDSASASYGTTYFDGQDWHMFYLGTPNTTPPPDRIPAFPYLTMKARSRSPAGPWIKQPEVVPFRPEPGRYYGETASPGQIVRQGDAYLQFFSAAMPRTIGIARTRDLNGPWTIDPSPILPPTEQIENSSLYFQESTGTWFLFTNHVGLRDGVEFTDAIWVYWTQDIERWDPARKAVVLDRTNASWSKTVIGLPSVLPVGDKLAIYYDGLDESAAAGEPFGHMRRDIGLAWLDLPIAVPPTDAQPAAPSPEPAVRLLDRFDPLDPSLSPVRGDAAGLPDPRCVLDRVGEGAPSAAPVATAGVLAVAGWTVLSARDGVAADAVLLSLQGESGPPLHVKTRREPRPDVKAHLGRPAMGDPGFVVTADLRSLHGAYRLDILQLRDGVAYPCGIDQPVVIE